MTRWLWHSLAVIFVILGFIGALLPGMPTTIFLILAAWAAGKGSPRLQAWLLNHPKYGPVIVQWREQGAVPRRAKWLAGLMMTASCTVVIVTNHPLWMKWSLPLIMAPILLWLVTRPEPHLPLSEKSDNSAENGRY